MIVKFYYGYGHLSGRKPFETVGSTSWVDSPVIPPKGAVVRMEVPDYRIDDLFEEGALTFHLANRFRDETSVVFKVEHIEYDYREGGSIHIVLLEDEE